MNIHRLLFSCCLAMSLGSCSGFFPSVGILTPPSLGGYAMDAAGLEGSYHFKFAENGTYQRVQTYPSSKKSTVKKGTWSWEKSSPKDAVLTLDGEMEITLHFTTRDHANATIPGSTRLFPVEFTESGF